MDQPGSLFEAIAQARETEAMTIVRRQIAAGHAGRRHSGRVQPRAWSSWATASPGGECYLPDLMFGGMIMKGVTAELAPLLEKGQAAKTCGTVVMGSVQHDVHDIGKDIVVTTMLRGVGFEVIDLGVDVPPEKFVEAVARHKPQVVGMSVLLTTCFKSVIATVEAIKQAGLRDGVAIMVGGAAASDLLRENAGCDFYGKTAVDGVKFASSVAGVA